MTHNHYDHCRLTASRMSLTKPNSLTTCSANLCRAELSRALQPKYDNGTTLMHLFDIDS